MTANPGRMLYVGATSDLHKRIWQHKNKIGSPAYVVKHNINRLVWFHEFTNMQDALMCEKKLKDWRREKKTALIEKDNPKWADLAEGWY